MITIFEAIDSSLHKEAIEYEIEMAAMSYKLSSPVFYIIRRFPEANNVLIFQKLKDAENYDKRYKIRVCKFKG